MSCVLVTEENVICELSTAGIQRQREPALHPGRRQLTVSPFTLKHSSVVKLCLRHILEHWDGDEKLHYSTLTLNKGRRGNGAGRHVDKHNVGPTLVKTIGSLPMDYRAGTASVCSTA